MNSVNSSQLAHYDPTILLKQLQKNIISERTPFYFIAVIFLLVAIVLSVLTALYSNENFSDFFPSKGYYYDKYMDDSHIVDRLCWFFSQLTHHTIVLLFGYFCLALVKRKSESYFKMVAPLALTISILYFYFLYPRQKMKLHQLPFANLFSHFMIIFLVFGEFIYIKDYTFKETTHCFIFILTTLCAFIINYLLRGVWSYNLIKLDRFSGWSLVSKTTIIMFLFSLCFFLIKHRKETKFGLSFKDIKDAGWTISGLINIIGLHMFIYIMDPDTFKKTKRKSKN